MAEDTCSVLVGKDVLWSTVCKSYKFIVWQYSQFVFPRFYTIKQMPSFLSIRKADSKKRKDFQHKVPDENDDVFLCTHSLIKVNDLCPLSAYKHFTCFDTVTGFSDRPAVREMYVVWSLVIDTVYFGPENKGALRWQKVGEMEESVIQKTAAAKWINKWNRILLT